MTEQEKNKLEKLGVEVIDLTKVPRDELPESDKEFLNWIESDGVVVTKIYHF